MDFMPMNNVVVPQMKLTAFWIGQALLIVRDASSCFHQFLYVLQ